MIPPIPTRRRNHRRTRMPRAIPYNSLPNPSPAVIVIPIHKPLIFLRPTVLRCSEHIYGFTGECAVEVPDVDFSVVGTGVDVALIGGSGRGEVAADEGFEDAVAAEGHEGAVVGVGGVV